MAELRLELVPPPFSRWMGPFSPSRGYRTGFRVNKGELGTFENEDAGSRFLTVVENSASRVLTQRILKYWNGGRVLILPNGFIVKPLQSADEVGERVLIGTLRGDVVLSRPGGPGFNMARPDGARPGARWLGPTTTGLECCITRTGSLRCTWYHPTDYGRVDQTEVLRGPDQRLADSFFAARPLDTSGRVRITVNGHVITNVQATAGGWESVYVGHVDSSCWVNWERWIA